MKRLYPIAFLLPILSACAVIMDGTDQQITVATTPPGASCDLTKNGMTIGQIPSTPGSALIEKTKYDIWVNCKKAGYQDANHLDPSGIDWWTAVDIVLLAPGWWAIDSIVGADNKYHSPVTIALPPLPAAAPGQPVITTTPTR